MNKLIECFGKCFGLNNHSSGIRSNSISTETLPSLISQDSSSESESGYHEPPFQYYEPGHVHLAYVSCDKECQQLRVLYPRLDPEVDGIHLARTTTCDPVDLIKTLRTYFGYTVAVRYFANTEGTIECEHDQRYKRREPWVDINIEHCLRCQDETPVDQIGALRERVDRPVRDGVEIRQNYIPSPDWPPMSDGSYQSSTEGYIGGLD